AAGGRDVSRPGRRGGAHGAPPRGAAPSVYARARLRRPARCPVGGAGAVAPDRRAHIDARARARLPRRAAMPVGDYALPHGGANPAGGRYGPPRRLLAQRGGRAPVRLMLALCECARRFACCGMTPAGSTTVPALAKLPHAIK